MLDKTDLNCKTNISFVQNTIRCRNVKSSFLIHQTLLFSEDCIKEIRKHIVSHIKYDLVSNLEQFQKAPKSLIFAAWLYTH